MNHIKAVRKSVDLMKVFGDDDRIRDKLIESMEYHLRQFADEMIEQLTPMTNGTTGKTHTNGTAFLVRGIKVRKKS